MPFMTAMPFSLRACLSRVPKAASFLFCHPVASTQVSSLECCRFDSITKSCGLQMCCWSSMELNYWHAIFFARLTVHGASAGGEGKPRLRASTAVQERWNGGSSSLACHTQNSFFFFYCSPDKQKATPFPAVRTPRTRTRLDPTPCRLQTETQLPPCHNKYNLSR